MSPNDRDAPTGQNRSIYLLDEDEDQLCIGDENNREPLMSGSPFLLSSSTLPRQQLVENKEFLGRSQRLSLVHKIFVFLGISAALGTIHFAFITENLQTAIEAEDATTLERESATLEVESTSLWVEDSKVQWKAPTGRCQGDPSVKCPFIFFHQRKTGGSTFRSDLIAAARHLSPPATTYIPCLSPKGTGRNLKVTKNIETNTGKTKTKTINNNKKKKTTSSDIPVGKNSNTKRKTQSNTKNKKQVNKPKPKQNAPRRVPKLDCQTYLTPQTSLYRPIPTVYGGHLHYPAFHKTMYLLHNEKRQKAMVHPPPSTNFTCMTIFREPVSRIHSCWNFRMVQTNKKNAKGVTKLANITDPLELEMSLTDAMSQFGEGCLNEPMRIFSDYGLLEDRVNHLHNLPAAIANDAVQQTIERSSQCIVGILERCNDTKAVIDRYLPFLAPYYVCEEKHKQNVGRVKKGELTDGQIEVIQTLARYEQEVYEEANRMLDLQLALSFNHNQ